RIRLTAGDHDFAHLLLVNRGRRPPSATVTASDPAVLLMSGATTGTPKGVLGTHGAYAFAGAQIHAWNKSVLKGPEDALFLPLLTDTKTRFEALTGARIVEGYSLTEAMMAACVNPVKGPNKLGSVGMPLPDVLVRIFDGDEGTRVLPPNDVGEIAISAPQLMV